tara:strand:- start:333 stop:614 length:282 start_codon:yes stop_codon:yes gene_type:complete
MSFQDFKNINKLINDIVGLDTKQGENLSLAIKNYFDTKPISVKLVSKDNMSFNINGILKHTREADAAMKRYTERLKEDTRLLKENGEFCGIGG